MFVEYKHMKSISILKGKVCQSIHSQWVMRAG